MPGLIGLLSDAHGNGPAFDRAIALLRAQGARRLYFLGDAVGYIPSPSVLASIDRLGGAIACVRGNHEAMLVQGSIDPVRDTIYQLGALRQRTAPELLQVPARWPASRRESIDGRSVLFVHGSPADPTFGYVYPDTDLDEFDTDDDVIFMGHTHRPFVREHAGRLFVNIGSCGLPRDDGRYGCAALFDPASRRVRLLRFDIQGDSARLLELHPDVHLSVRSLFERRAENLVGEILC